MDTIVNYLNPMRRLGNATYSFLFPLIVNLIFVIVSEVYMYGIAKNPTADGTYIILLSVLLIVYFAFRDGLLGGFISVAVIIPYYFYIIETRHFHGPQLASSIDTTIALGLAYILLAAIIGFLRQIVDKLIEKEADARIRLRTILEQLPVGVIVSNPEGEIEFINKQTRKLYGRDVAVGTQVGTKPEVVQTYDGKKVKKTDAPSVQTLLTGKASKDREFLYTRPNGEHIFVNTHAAPIKNKKGKIIAIASISSDITVQKEQEQRKDDFIRMASHELKTPLTSIKVFTQVLEKKLVEKKDTELTRLVSRLNTQINKLTLLVSDLLDMTRVEKGTLKVQREKFLIKPLVEEIVEDLQPITTHKLLIRWTTRLPVFGDRERIRQVLTNLITNAIKYSPPNGKILIGSRREDDCIEVYVQDFGIGIPKSEQKKIFNRFYQVSEQSTYPGLGLGLYISNEIIKQHHGKMWVESEKDKGSTFWFSLPIYKK